MSGILIVSLTQRGKAIAATLELVTAANSLAKNGASKVEALCLGAGAKAAAQELIDFGVVSAAIIESKILDNLNDVLYARAIAEFATKEGHDIILLTSNIAGKSIAARVAVLLNASFAANVSSLDGSGDFKVNRSQFSGNVTAFVSCPSTKKVFTVEALVFPRAEKKSGATGQIKFIDFDPGASKIEFIAYRPEESNEIDLSGAERIVSGGRGLSEASGFKMVYDLANSISAAVGASRAVVDSGWIAYRHQVGLTGKTVRPKLYIACGISGQIQHLAGMSSAGTIVAINTDDSCPMMQMASISVQGDVKELIPLIIEEIKKRRG